MDGEAFRRNFMVPIRHFKSWEASNAHLADQVTSVENVACAGTGRRWGRASCAIGHDAAAAGCARGGLRKSHKAGHFSVAGELSRQ